MGASNQSDDSALPCPQSGIPWRAILIGLAFVLYFALGGPGGYGGFHLPPGSLLVLVVLIGIFNPLARLFGRRPLNPVELGLIWAMVLVGVMSILLSEYLPPSIAGPRYFASRENQWARLFHQYLPSWLFVSDPEAIRTFYEGLPPGGRTPWRLWALPIFMWLMLAFAFFAMMSFGAVMLRQQWVERERLSFPIVQLPAEIAFDAANIPGRRRLLASGLMWAGFALAAGCHTLNNLHEYFRVIPFIDRRIIVPLEQLPRPWREASPIYLYIIPTVIGFAYLLPTEISMSFWFFFLFGRLEAVIGGAFGFPMPYTAGYVTRTFLSHQEFGAFLAVGAGILYSSRHHLRAVWNAALRPDGADADEPVSYRFAVFGFLAAALVAVVWFIAAGLPIPLAVAIVSVFFVISLVGSWVIAAGGVLFLQNSFGPTRILASVTGSSPMTPSGLTMLKIPEQVFMSDLRGLEMPNFFNGLRLADYVRARRAATFWAMMAALAVGVITSTMHSLWASYRHGALTYGSSWANINAAQIPGQTIASWLQSPEEPNLGYVVWVIIGAAAAGGLFHLRAQFVRWPLHPIGFTLAGSYAMFVLWSSFFFGWVIKALVVRYGGLRIFLRLRPFFLGLVLGDCVSGSLWAIPQYFTHIGSPIWPG